MNSSATESVSGTRPDPLDRSATQTRRVTSPGGSPVFGQARRGLLRWSGTATLLGYAVAVLLAFWLLPGYLLTVAVTALATSLVGFATGSLYTYVRALFFGAGGFYAIGAYVMMLGVGERGWPLLIGIVVAAVLPGVAAAVLAPLVFRLEGIYFALITFAFSELIRQIIVAWSSFTGGQEGVSLRYRESPIPGFEDVQEGTYWLAVICCFVVLAGFLWYRHHPAGIRAVAVGDDRDMARSLGVRHRRLQLGHFVVAGMICGLAGVITAFNLRFVEPEEFGSSISLGAVVVLIIGGWRIVPGPIIGSALVVFVPQVFDVDPLYQVWIYGGGLAVVILLFHDGVAGTLIDLTQRTLRRRRAGTPRASAT